MKENIKFIAITKDNKEVELCITNKTKLECLIKIIDGIEFTDKGYLDEFYIKEDNKIIKRKVRKRK